jgi:thiol:disulfide interchange protein
MLALGVAWALAWVWAARPRLHWDELSAAAKAGRGAALASAGVGVALVVFAATQAPPLLGESPLVWEEGAAAARARAAREGKPLMVDFSAEWCAACHELEAEVFNDPEVAERLGREFVLLKVDFDDPSDEAVGLVVEYEVSGLPRVAFSSPGGEYLKGPSFDGKLSKAEFEGKMDAALAGEGAGGDALGRALGEGRWWWAMALAFVAGLLASLTPCVYPLIPITISVFGAAGAESRAQAFGLSATYVLGIVVTYSTLGVGAAWFGGVFGAAMNSAWVTAGIALLFLVLGVGSMEVVQLSLPGGLQAKLSQRGGAGWVGAFVMGLVAGVIAAPCVGPVVAGVLLYVAKTQDVALGWALMASFALGMGMLFLVLGTFSGLLGKLPRSGAWMGAVKAVFAAVFFGMALYYARLFAEPLGAGADALWVVLGALVT